MNSLRARLLVFLLALAAAVALAVGFVTYRTVLHETDQLFDYHLRQMALSLRDQGAIAADERAALGDEPFDYVVQIWSDDGGMVYASHAAPGLPVHAVLGFTDLAIDGARWRVFSATARDRVIQVAQPLAIRRELAAAAALRSVTPLLAAAPLVAVALWWLVGLSLAPLAGVARAVQARDAESMHALPATGLPPEIAPLVDALNALLARLRTAFEAQRAFVADAAHELRSPLTALKLQVDLLRRAPDAAARDEATAQLAAGVERAHHLVEQLLTLARAEPGAAEAAFAPVELAEAVRQATADAVPLASARGVALEFDARYAGAIDGDAGALRVLARNLIDNAVRYAGAGARVAVAVLRDERAIVLCVDDSGPGIPAAERERVFDRFYRRDPGAETGSGLGLSIARAIAERHGARLALADSPLGGLRVEVRFPPGSAPAPR